MTLKNKTSWNKGLRYKCPNISKALKGHVPWNKGLRYKFNRPAWNSGMKYPPELVEKLRKCHLGIRHKPEAIEKLRKWHTGLRWTDEQREKLSGKHHWNWRGGITPAGRKERGKFKNNIQKMVLERDNYTCQICNKRGGALQVDHIQKWADYIEGRFNMNNCRTLCMKCHYKITFGREMPENIKTWGHNFKYKLS